MKSLVRSLLAVAVLGLAVYPAAGRVGAAPAHATMKLRVKSVKPTSVTKKHGAVTFRLQVSGITLDARHMGKANQSGHGHIQIYVDKIPKDAYSRKDLKHNWLAALAAPDFSLNLTPAVLGGRGKHRIFVTLARNNYVLYRTGAVAVTITAK